MNVFEEMTLLDAAGPPSFLVANWFGAIEMTLHTRSRHHDRR
jgi:hypothetical protein